MPITQAVIAEHRNLEAQLSATAYAPPTLAQVRAQAERVLAAIAADQAGLDALKRRTEREHKDWRDIETRTLKRLWVRVKHPIHGRERLTDLEAKEEAEYVAARTAELSAAARLDLLKSQSTALQQQVGQLSSVADSNARAAAALQALYSVAFDGPTPQFPQEDAVEGAYTAAVREYETAQGARWAEGEALRLLKEADQLLGSAIKTTRGAGDFATINSYGGPANFDILERSELAGAQRDADQARLLVQQAGQVLPGMPGIQAVELPKGNMVADVFFDTTWSELAFQGRIDAADTHLQNARKSLGVIIEQVQRQVGSSSPAAQAALQRLEQTRAALFEVRRNIMNSL
ncbi:hypothetical protein CcaverHIS002_0307520 [Cutaneotrichosporon cavernicola]|nr:hypothetical protein CcaverHIS002_0307520 [Cutaneotrichosporon cavernicola]BEI98451.1 hypothetical protein CcaverHIS631_0307500 [Cutaneotrichosporon cavernicola]BEJ06224.1 hypothetical protein CcaverHIS641_0307460 [Cutaneotrichosporon cavernicola]